MASAYDHLRVSDNERINALSALTVHYTDGRLDDAEFNRRSDIITAATTQRELRRVFVDLPGGFPFTSNSAGELTPVNLTQRTEISADAELEELQRLKKKGDTLRWIDNASGPIIFLLFAVGSFVFHPGIAWVVFLLLPFVSESARWVLKFSKADEKTYKKLHNAEQKERAQRLEQAAIKMRELEGRSRTDN